MKAEERYNLNQIKQVTDSILELINQSDKNSLSEDKLQTVAGLEKKRQHLINDFFSHPVAQGDSAEVAIVIKQVLQTNDQVTKILEQNKLQLTKEFNQFKTAKKATAPYPLKHFFLQNPQNFNLHWQRHITNFIQKQCTALG